jgi:hypothetical protein
MSGATVTPCVCFRRWGWRRPWAHAEGEGLRLLRLRWIVSRALSHRVRTLLAFPSFLEDPDKETHTGIHHSAFEYANLDELNASYLRLKECPTSASITG